MNINLAALANNNQTSLLLASMLENTKIIHRLEPQLEKPHSLKITTDARIITNARMQCHALCKVLHSYVTNKKK